MIRSWVPLLIAGMVGVAHASLADEILKLPDGSWIGPPVVVEGKPAKPREYKPVWSQSANAVDEPRFEITISEEASWVRAIYDKLPKGIQKTIKSPPPVPGSITFQSSPVNQALVFPSGGSDLPEKYVFAFLDAKGNIGHGGRESYNGQLGGLLYFYGLLPRLSPTVTLAVWEKQPGYSHDYSKPPVGTMSFANPLLAPVTATPTWPNGKQQLAQEWRGLKFTFNKAVRRSNHRKGMEGSLFEFKIEGQKAEDFQRVEWRVEDNAGGYFAPDSAWYSRGEDLLSFGTDSEVLWPDNLNWRLRFSVVPKDTALMLPSEYKRVRIDLPDVEKLELTTVESVIELNGALIRNVRVSPDTGPQMWSDKEEIKRWYVPAKIQFEVQNAKPGTVIHAMHFHDGVLPFADRRSDIQQGRETSDKGSMKLQIALDKSADFLEFVIAATPVETLEFYFQPELISAK